MASDAFQEQFNDLWRKSYAEAETKFSELTRKYLQDPRFKDGRPALRKDIKFENLEAQLTAVQEVEEEARRKHKKWTNAVLSVARPLEQLGGLASGIISAAFPAAPTGLAFNAISYLITTGREVRAAYDTIAALFDKIQHFLERLSLHTEQGIPRQLVDIVHQILLSLIIVCALSIRLLKNKVWKTYISQAFLGEDKEIRAQVDNIEKLTGYEVKMVNALTLHEVRLLSQNIQESYLYFPELKEDVKDIKSKLDVNLSSTTEILTIEKKRESTTNHRRQLDLMKTSLGSEGNKTADANRQALNSIMRSRIPDTGVGLINHPEFDVWLREETPVLVVYGEFGTGKSFLAANTLNYLSKKFPQEVQAASQASVVGHFFKSNNSDLRGMKQALQCMAYQIAGNDTVYANYFERECKSFNELQTVDQIWDKAFLQFFRSPDFVNRAYVVVDGLDQLKPDDRTTFLRLMKDLCSKQTGERRVRVQLLVFETPSRDPVESHLGKNTRIIQWDAKANEQDLRIFVSEEVDKVNTWSRWRIREEIISAVVSKARGQFASVGYQIQDLKTKRRKEDVQEALRQEAQEVPAAVRDELQRLGEDLDPFELDEVRKLLTWLVWAKDDDLNTLAGMNEILNWDQSDSDFEQLEGQLRDRYATLFDVVRLDQKTTDELKRDASLRIEDSSQSTANDNIEVYHSDPKTTTVSIKSSVRQYFLDGKINVVSETSDEVREAELRIVKRYLDLLCDAAMQTRLGFDDVFSQKRQQTADRISLDKEKAAYELLKTSLSVITNDNYDSDATVENSTILRHAVKWFTDYLTDVTIASVSSDDGKFIVERLIRVFSYDSFIQRWAIDNIYLTGDLLSEYPRCTCLLAWFEEPRFVEGIWMEEIKSEDKKVSLRRLFKPVIDVIAVQWLQDTRWEPSQAYRNVRAYIDCFDPAKGSDEAEPTEDGKDEKKVQDETMTEARDADEGGDGAQLTDLVTPPSDSEPVINAANWTQLEVNSLWFARVGATLLSLGEYSEASKHLDRSVLMDDKNWRALKDLGASYLAGDEPDNLARALATHEKSLAVIEALPEDEKPQAAVLVELLQDLARTSAQLDQPERSSGFYTQAFNLAPRNYGVAIFCLQSLDAQKKRPEVFQLLQHMDSDFLQEEQMTRLNEFLLDLAYDDDINNLTLRAVRHCQAVDFLKVAYEKSLGIAEQKGNDAKVVWLKLWVGNLLLQDYRHQDEAVKYFEQVMESTADLNFDPVYRWARHHAVRRLANTYFENARSSSNHLSDEAQLNISKLRDLSASRDADTDNPEYGFDYNVIANVSFLLGRWYSKWSPNDEEATRHLKPNIVLGIKLLSDDIDYNDVDAYLRLGAAFMACGDDDHALAAWSALGPTKEVQTASDEVVVEEQPDPAKPEVIDNVVADAGTSTEAEHVEASVDEGLEAPSAEEVTATSTPETVPVSADAGETDSSAEAEVVENSGISFECDGCGKSCGTAEDIHHCRDCLSLDLCSDCQEKVRTDTLGPKICWKEHDWIHVPKPEGPLPPKTVRLKGEVVGLETWKEMIKQKWNIV